ncbi:MAG: sulfotransferase [Polyangiales bacterium]
MAEVPPERHLLDPSAKSLGPPFPISMFTRLADPVRGQLIRVDADRVMRMAERLNGLDDYGDDHIRERLEETIECVLQTDWNALGRFALRYVLNWNLGNRLRAVELLKQRPDILDIPIERPIVITGLFRTGTTFLHNVLAADPANRTARMWELARPIGRKRDLLGDAKWRGWRTSHEVAMDDMIVPEQREAHKIDVDAYEEDFFLLESAMAVMIFFVGFGSYGYGMRMLEWDMTEPYRWHQRQLQILWAQRSASRWLLKCPWHLWNLRALFAVYPDALVIQTHRGLVDTIGSQCSLSARIASKFQRDLDLHQVGRFWLEYSRIGVQRGLEARAGVPETQIHDVRLHDLEERPLEAIAEIYERFGLPFDDELAARLSARIEEDPTPQFGEHDYDIADYGLSEAEIQDAFSEYRARFGV